MPVLRSCPNKGDLDTMSILRDDGSFDPRIEAAFENLIKRVIKEELGGKLRKIDDDLEEIKQLKDRVEEVEKGLKFSSERLESLVKTTLPSVCAHMTKLAESLALQTLNIDTHRRKWNLVLHGIEGQANEEENLTRDKCVKFAKDVLEVEDASPTHLSACHRLSPKPNSGIIIRFCDLSRRDAWMSGTKNLKSYPKKVSLSPDLPPSIRPMKDELMIKRRDLDTDEKTRSRVRYLREFPFVDLRIANQNSILPTTQKRDLVKTVLGLDPVFEIIESTSPILE